MAISDLPILSMLRTKMQWHQERQKLLAENVANADTPKFKPRDLAPMKFENNRPPAAGGIALATTSTPDDPHARTTSESTTTGDAAPSLVIASPTPTGSLDDPEDLAGFAEAAGTPAAGDPDRADDADDAVRATPSPKPVHPTGRCRALTNISEDGQAGKATASPAFTDLDCTQTDTAAEPTRPTGRPDVAPGNPDQRTGKPDTIGNAKDDTATDEAAKAEKAGKNEDDSNAEADTDGGGTADRGKSGEHRQDG